MKEFLWTDLMDESSFGSTKKAWSRSMVVVPYQRWRQRLERTEVLTASLKGKKEIMMMIIGFVNCENMSMFLLW